MLPDILPDIDPVSLADLVQRLAQRIFADIQSLLETLPANNQHVRRTDIAVWVRELRRQLAKLLVVVRWSRHSHAVQTSMAVIAFLQSIQQRFDDARNGLRETLEEYLSHARVRNYDLTSALDLLVKHSYLRLPSIVKDTYAPPSPLTDSECIKIIHQLNSTIQYRLAVHEYIPHPLRNYTIEDGRAYFNVPNLFKTSLTVDSIEPDGPWFMLHVEFLFEAYDSVGRRLINEPWGDLREHINQVACDELAPRTAPDKRDAPFVRLYNFLQTLSLDYKLQALYRQCSLLHRTAWSSHILIKLSAKDRSLDIIYWTNKTSLPQHSQQHNPTSTEQEQSKITIIVSSKPKTDCISKILGQLQLESQTDMPLSDALNDTSLRIMWKPVGIEVSEKDTRDMEDGLISLDAKAILDAACRKHMEIAINRCYQQLVKRLTKSQFHSDDITLQNSSPTAENDDNTPYIRIQLFTSSYIDIRICRWSGELTLAHSAEDADLNVIVDTDVAKKRLQAAALHANADWNNLADVITHLRFLIITERIESSALCAGYTPTKRPVPKLRKEDVVRLGEQPSILVWIQLPAFPLFYVVITVGLSGLRLVLVSLRLSRNTQFLYEIEDMLTMERQSMKTEQEHDKRYLLSRADIEQMCMYSTMIVGLLKVERQLRLQNIPFRSVGPSTTQVPILRIQAQDIITTTTTIRNRSKNCSLDCSIGIVVLVSGGSHVKVVFKMQLDERLRHTWNEMRSSSSNTGNKRKDGNIIMDMISGGGDAGVQTSWDDEHHTLTFASEDVDRSVLHFLRVFAHIVNT